MEFYYSPKIPDTSTWLKSQTSIKNREISAILDKDKTVLQNIFLI